MISIATAGADLLRMAREIQPGIIIMDAALPGMEGLPPLQQLALVCSQAKVILSWHRHQQPLINEASLTGYAGCIVHDAHPADYYMAIKQVIKGKVFYCTHTERVINAGKGLPNPADSTMELLNEKNSIMLYCMWLGYSSKEIAIAMNLSKETINTYRKKLKKIIGSHSFSALESLMKKNETVR